MTSKEARLAYSINADLALKNLPLQSMSFQDNRVRYNI